MSSKETEAVYDLAALAQTYLRRAEAAEALLAERIVHPVSEVRGYVVLTAGKRGELEIRDGILYDDQAEANGSAVEYRANYGQAEAHVGVVTALPTEA